MNKNYLNLGLDWDGTISCYFPELGLLAQQAAKVVIITINDEITVEQAAKTLNIDEESVSVWICPDERIDDYGVWKAETCLAHDISLMIDDELPVVTACWSVGVPALLVVKRGLTETKDFLNTVSCKNNNPQ